MTRSLLSLLALIVLPGCIGIFTDPPATDTGSNLDSVETLIDTDGDGFTADVDCNDDDATVHPGALEVCNGVDDDCNDAIDDSPSDGNTYYADADGDGDGGTTTFDACAMPAGYVATSTDCDDTDATVNLEADELCNGIDDNCDGTIDESSAVDASTYYADADADGYGDLTVTTVECNAPPGFVADMTDCDDTNAAINRGTAEVACNGDDDNCDGTVDESLPVSYLDRDGDGFGDPATAYASCVVPPSYTADDTDCNDADATINPAAAETCNSFDDNCDGSIDEGVETTYYADGDSDGYGGTTTASACSAPAGYVATSTDCDDATAAVHPSATELCNGFDDDCDGLTDEPDAADASTWYADADADSFGGTTTATACTAPAGYVADETDCNDANAMVNPLAVEFCNGIDDDCDGTADETDAFGAPIWYADVDGDRFGDTANVEVACTAPSGFIADAGDCDDLDATVNPDETEVCNGVDDNCDGLTDDSTAADASTWFNDRDADSFGNVIESQKACTQPTGTVADDTDCVDVDPAINPAATETCNGLDDDCDGTTDEADASGAPTWYADADGDDHGDADTTEIACDQPSGYVASNDDCNPSDGTDYSDVDGDGFNVCEGGDCEDRNDRAYPGATEYVNDLDDNCNGVIDDGTDAIDNDGDGFNGADDCDDANAAVYPGATEVCDGIDNNCTGGIDESSAANATTWYADTDADGYGEDAPSIVACNQPVGFVSVAGDCNDNDSTFNPGASEACDDATDYNCDGSTGYADADGDGVAACNDCNDIDPAAYPGATEVCDDIDNDCNGLVDDSAADAATWYADADHDSYGDPTSSEDSCAQPSGYVADDTDCRDTNDQVHPSATEIANGIDDNCDGNVDGGTDASDDDGDGYTEDAGDCNDGDASVNPGAIEVCDGVDNNCTGGVDESTATDAKTWHPDDDSDGYGNVADPTVIACNQPTGYTENVGDCDDNNSAYNPGASESDCTDPNDYNCDGSVEFADADADGSAACLDCNDASATVHPGAIEICNEVDDDCNGLIDDDASGSTTWYVDIDLDTFGNNAVSQVACDQPSGYVADGNDCRDTDDQIHPGAIEYCNGLDDNCDGTIDDGAMSIWYSDVDDDGFGGNTIADACAAPSGYVDNNDDCDDSARVINPDAIEACSDADLNCNGVAGTIEGDCIVPITCSDDGAGNMTVDFTVPTMLSGYAWQSAIVPVNVNWWLWDIDTAASYASTAYTGDGVVNTLTAPDSGFTPEAEDGLGNLAWANLNAWYVDPTCASVLSIEVDAAGTGLYVAYVGP